MTALLFFTAGLYSCGVSGTPSYHMTAIFPSAISLYPKSEVEVLGMKVGTVQSVKVEGDADVRVSFTVHQDVPLPAGVSAVIVPQSLLGARYVELYPAWVEGQPELDPSSPDQLVIPRSRTSVPAEPDQALAAVNNLLKSLNPAATGRLVTNLNQDLAGNGQNLNNAITSLAGIANTLADKDQDLVTLINNLDQFTTVLDTRESQLGQVMDLFASVTSLLAEERNTIASLVTNLASVSTNALSLVSQHAAPLQGDIASLDGLVQTLDANLGNVSTLLSSLPELADGPDLNGKAGFIAAYDPTYHRIDLRDSLGTTVNGLLQALGLPLCLSVPGLDSTPQCAPGSISLARPATKTAASSSSQVASPLAAVFNLLGNGGSEAPQLASYGVAAAPAPAPRHGLMANVARWAHSALRQLW